MEIFDQEEYHFYSLVRNEYVFVVLQKTNEGYKVKVNDYLQNIVGETLFSSYPSHEDITDVLFL